MPLRMLESISLKGYKSFRELDLTLGAINVLIGANGAGKSNFIGLFKMLNRMMNEELQIYVAQAGGADQILHYGRKVTERLELELWFRWRDTLANGYLCHLLPAEEGLLVAREGTYFHDRMRYARPYQDMVHQGLYPESRLPQWVKERRRVAAYVYEAMLSWQLYHFHDTGPSARVKQPGDIQDNRFLLPDAANLAAYLYLLREKHPQHYRNIIETIRLATPFFGDFILRPNPLNPEKIRLEWRERGSDLTFGPNALSDGTLRFICLTTLFLQPPESLPATIVLDEPELGLHPYAIVLLAEMVHSVAEHSQVILATQSVSLVNQFTPQEILVLDRVEGLSTIRRLEEAEIAHWLDEYGLGELWEKNILGGRPAL
ncbi:MAG TPA: AAA family ATPase [Anaerolineae bacterium]|nr:AAA family ATPase [Anaerolineae bacterium]